MAKPGQVPGFFMICNRSAGARLITIKIHHKTTYRFRWPVSLWQHRLMLRPRERAVICAWRRTSSP
jgi:hypothetical protein